MQLPLRSGVTLDNGRYRIEELLGGGGFGIAYKAWDVRQQKWVVVKEFFPKADVTRLKDDSLRPLGRMLSWDDWHLTDMARARLLRDGSTAKTPFEKYRDDVIQEAIRLGRLRHPHILPATDNFTENNTAYVVMDFIEGQTLREYVEEQSDGTLSVDEILGLLRPIAEALGYAHGQGIIHRDVTPNNILRDAATGAPYLIDFGAAREYDESDDGTTLTFIATEGYAAPEQYTGKGQGPHSDVYSLAAVAYRLATRRSPLKATARHDKDGRDLMTAPRILRPDLPDWFDRALRNALTMAPGKRTQNMRDLLAEMTSQNPAPIHPAQIPRVTPDTISEQRIALARPLWEAALKVTETLKDGFWQGHQQSFVLAEVAASIARTDPDLAVLVTDRIVDIYRRFDALAGVAGLVARADADRGLQIAEKISDTPRRLNAIMAVAAAVARTDLDRGLQIAESVAGGSREHATFAGVAAAIAHTAPDKGLMIAESINNTRWKANALAGVAAVIALTNPAEALRITNSIATQVKNVTDLSGVAAAIARIDPDRGLMVAESIVNWHWKATALSGVAVAIARTDLERGLQIANRIPDTPALSQAQRSQALAAVAAAIARTDPIRSDETARAALQIAEGIVCSNTDIKAQALVGVIAAIALQEPEEATRIANGIGYGRYQVQALTRIASVLAGHNPYDDWE